MSQPDIVEDSPSRSLPIEMWGGPECTFNRVRNRYFDQISRSGHRLRLDDLDRFAALGITTLRYPVLWESVAPDSLSQPHWEWSDRRMERMRELGIRPIVGLLHHGSGPSYTSLLDPAFPLQLAHYAGLVAARYPWVRDYTPVNEPLTTARFSALYGHWYPHSRNDRDFVRAVLNQLWGVVLAMASIRRINPEARLVQTEDCGQCFGTRETRTQVRFENHRRWLTWDLLTGRVTPKHPLYAFLRAGGASVAELERFVDTPTPPQVVGLNYYVTSDRFLDHRLDRYDASRHGGNMGMAYADVEAVRARAGGILGHRAHLVAAWNRYRLPVALTEVHLACTREEQTRWLLEAWDGAHRARDKGAEVVAVTAWALLGSYDWDSLVTDARNRYEAGAFDVRSTTPRPTAVARAIRQLATGTAVKDPPLDAPGWWRTRKPHLISIPTRSDALRGRHRPLLIVGATGTLGKAFRRIATERGLAVRCLGRRDLDITNAASVYEVARRVRPWAVVNATGYVRVDDAERDSETCFGVNTVGAVNVATACCKLQLPVVTYSSDLVFSGDRDHPYTEDDQPHPLNVYGASKAEAERRILEVMPTALVIRTSAFFGPWDNSNFVVRALDAIRRGDRWRAAADVVVSPTYVPDLVHATLDLLLDRESGIWHLSNAGPISWFEFARSAALACGASLELIEPSTASALGWPATRPRYSALSSVRGQVMRSTEEALDAFAAEHRYYTRRAS